MEKKREFNGSVKDLPSWMNDSWLWNIFPGDVNSSSVISKPFLSWAALLDLFYTFIFYVLQLVSTAKMAFWSKTFFFINNKIYFHDLATVWLKLQINQVCFCFKCSPASFHGKTVWPFCLLKIQNVLGNVIQLNQSFPPTSVLPVMPI